MDGTCADQSRLECADLGGIKSHEIVDAGLGAARHHRVQRGKFLLARSDNQLAAAPIGNASPFAEIVEKLASFNAELRLQRSIGIIEPGMDHAAVACGSNCAELVFALEDQHVVARERQRARDCQPNYACPHNDRADFVHSLILNPRRRAGNVFYARHGAGMQSGHPRSPSRCNVRRSSWGIAIPVWLD